MDRTSPRAAATAWKTTLPLRGPLLGRVDDGVVESMIARAQARRLSKRAALWRSGEPVTAVFWVRSGVIGERALFDGREFVLGFHGRGDVVGEGPAMLAISDPSARYDTSAEAHEEAAIYELTLEALDEFLQQDAALAMGFAAVLAERARAAEARLGALLVRSAPARMAAALLQLAGSFGVRDSRGIIVNLKLTHRDLAGLVGASRETASVALLDWRRDGLVAVEGKRVVLLDLPRLQAVARDERPAPG